METAIAAVLHFMAEDQRTCWMIVIIAFGFLFQATNVIEFYFQAKVQSKFTVRARVTKPHITSQ